MDFSKVQRVLIYRLGSLGDTLIALPALHLIERTFPNAHRILLTNLPVHAKAPAAGAVLDGSGLVHGYMAYPVGTRSIRELTSVWWQIRKFRPDVLVYLMPSRGDQAVRRDALFFRLCGIRTIIGLPFGELADNRLDPVTHLREPEAARLLRCIASLGRVDVNDLTNWNLRLTSEENRNATRELTQLAGSRFIMAGISGKIQATDWGVENWRALFEKLSLQLPEHALVLVGAKEDVDSGEIARAGWKGKSLNLCGSLTPRETAAVAAKAELFVGADSGPKYLAAIAGVPCAIAYSARNPAGIWFPPGNIHRNVYHEVDCAHCALDVCIENKKKCLASITVNEMLLAALEAWHNGQR
jgi:ADP-heptose:LPS heptosyltransferase